MLAALDTAGPMYATELARAAGTSAQHVLGALQGSGDAYRADRGLVPLGLARATWTAHGALYRRTTRGRLVLRAWRLGAPPRGAARER